MRADSTRPTDRAKCHVPNAYDFQEKITLFCNDALYYFIISMMFEHDVGTLGYSMEYIENLGITRN